MATPPELCWCVLSLVVRSGETTSHEWPPSVVRWTCWLPTYTVLLSCGEMWIGNVQCQRNLRSAGAQP